MSSHPRGPRAKGEGEGERKEKGKRTPWAFDYPKPFPTAKLNPLSDWAHYNLIIMSPIRSVCAVEIDSPKITSKQVDPTHCNKRAVMLGLTRTM